jgi:hypothetical protein
MARVSIHPLQSLFIFFKLFQPLWDAGFHATLFGFPLVEDPLEEAAFPDQFFHRDAFFRFLQDIDDLCFADL